MGWYLTCSRCREGRTVAGLQMGVSPGLARGIFLRCLLLAGSEQGVSDDVSGILFVGCAVFQSRASNTLQHITLSGTLLGHNTLLWGLCRKALRAQAQALAEQPFSREAYARDLKQARARRSHVLLSC